MRRRILIVMAVMFGAVSAVTGIYMLGMRSGNRIVREAARRFHRGLGNPIQLRAAGATGAFTSVVKHRGRITGVRYETPVWAMPTEDGFAIATVYGPGTDWVRNVLAAGCATIVHGGETYAVDRPEIVPAEAARAYFPTMLRTIHREMGVDRYLRVRRTDRAEAPAA